MEFSYFEPAPELRQFVSSYYFVSLPFEIADIMRAEIANARFILEGTVWSDLSGEYEAFPAGASVLCGPTYRWSRIKFAEHTRVFGAAITPLGWRRMFAMSAEEAADLHLPFAEAVPAENRSLIDGVFTAADNQQVVAAADKLFLSLVTDERSVHEDFIKQATDWIVDPEPNEIEHLLDNVDFSHRQVERLCKAYFGSGPKKLHRKFRALHAANRLTWQNLDDWRDVARTAYYDQAHFIREFKQFNGRTPKEFMDGPHILVRMTLEERLKINHASPFSLVG
ncbi:AraC family transcriptional regulator [Hyphococcus flavus]|uniref:AraC family transcriptional regulator n=1 Tax=Hyphococcus flavus TaxID=1866326 RepID=A0AAE9ZHC1_9PROT|nr:AraC family transcriptional regulator [Hyphococcus flavus]WDI30846.1 AraC family transcriptional regulator [Hyphococcus flavus]